MTNQTKTTEVEETLDRMRTLLNERQAQIDAGHTPDPEYLPLLPFAQWVDATFAKRGLGVREPRRQHRISPEAQARFLSDSLTHQRQLIELADSLVLTVQYIGLDVPDTWQGWRWEAGHTLLQQDNTSLKAHGLELMLDDLIEEPDLCTAILEQLRDALHRTNTGPFNEVTPAGLIAAWAAQEQPPA